LTRRSSFLENLMQLPWPIGAVMAILCYPVALLLSGYLASQPNPVFQAMSSVPLRIWWFFAALFGFASLVSFIIGQKKKNLYKQNQSLQLIRNLIWRQFEFYIGQAYLEKGYFVVETPVNSFGDVQNFRRAQPPVIFKHLLGGLLVCARILLMSCL